MMNIIPKKIHYVWVGNKPKPQLVLDCISTWEKHFPDYEIIEWNNEKFKGISNKYAEEAFANKRWAFVSDYIRLHALYHEGGIYLDTDVEVTNNFDRFMNLDFFSCHEFYNNNCWPITSAVMGAKKNSRIIGDLIDIYDEISFKTKRGLDLTANTQRITKYLESRFNIQPEYDKDSTLKLSNTEIIFPSHYFCISEEDKVNFSIHHFSGSWLPSHSRKDKINIFNKIILSRFIKMSNFGEMPLQDDERIVFRMKLSKNKKYIILFRK